VTTLNFTSKFHVAVCNFLKIPTVTFRYEFTELFVQSNFIKFVYFVYWPIVVQFDCNTVELLDVCS